MCETVEGKDSIVQLFDRGQVQPLDRSGSEIDCYDPKRAMGFQAHHLGARSEEQGKASLSRRELLQSIGSLRRPARAVNHPHDRMFSEGAAFDRLTFGKRHRRHADPRYPGLERITGIAVEGERKSIRR